jgi:hypothetical protein
VSTNEKQQYRKTGKPMKDVQPGHLVQWPDSLEVDKVVSITEDEFTARSNGYTYAYRKDIADRYAFIVEPVPEPEAVVRYCNIYAEGLAGFWCGSKDAVARDAAPGLNRLGVLKVTTRGTSVTSEFIPV